MERTMFADVLIEHAFLGNQTLTYSTGSLKVGVGERVMIPLREREIMGFVVRVHQEEPSDFEVQTIIERVDGAPILNEELQQLSEWLSYYTVSPKIRCLQTILPNKLSPKSTSKSAKIIKMITRTNKNLDTSLTSKQLIFLKMFEEMKMMTLKDASKTYSGFQKLVEKGYLERIDMEAFYQEKVIEKSTPHYSLTPEQKKIVDSIAFDCYSTTLVHGVTGSGKTEVYLDLASKVLEHRKQVLILVPEISLTPQMIERVSKRFGQDVAIYHSGLGDQEKYEQYRRVKDQKVSLVVGTRSAVFLPFSNLGLIVMDEEHDNSYKQESTPYYHTRDVASWRAKYHKCPLVLGSASPAIESYARALKGVYKLVELPMRINHSFPKVEVVDTQKALYNRESPYLTQHLENEIQRCLDNKKQVVILLNRRGYMTLLKDSNGEVIQCPDCDVALNYHKADQSIRCHMCGHNRPYDPLLKLSGSGVGTQRLEEALLKRFPSASIIRMDADTTSRKNSHATLLEAFMNHKTDILIGTQMIAKGLDNEKVTLVGIVNADAALTHTDYRAVEITFQMMLQASGRAGRGQYPGKVIIQTANPGHYAIVCAIHQKYKHFFKQEMQYRKIAAYPPYSYLVSLVFSADTEKQAFDDAQNFAQFVNTPSIDVLGPSILRKLSRKYRARVILRGKDLEQLIETCHSVMAIVKPKNRTGVSVDVNPLTLE